MVALLSVLVIALLGLAAPSVAAAAPYVPAGGQTITLNRTIVGVDGVVTVTTTGCVPGHDITFSIHSAVVVLGTFTANATGVASGQVTTPAGFIGVHTIVANDPLNGQTWTISLTIVDSAVTTVTPTTSSGASDTGGLPNTGAAAMGLGVLALVLLAGGATLLLFGRRRKSHSH